MERRWQVGIDIGGTFTDVVAVSSGGLEIRTAKVHTLTDDRVASLMAALTAVGLDWAEVEDLVHGTTMVTNAIVEGDLAEVALVATEGFADTLAIGRQNRAHLYRLDLAPKEQPLVPAERRLEIAGRLDHDGEELIRLDADAADALGERLAASGARAVAVSLMHSYANPAHEEAVGERLRAHMPFVALSHKVNPEAREYERAATTVLSAAVMPLASDYLDRLDAARPAGTRLHLFHSAGGMAALDALRELPLSLAMSGPAAGVTAASAIARDLELAEAISFDMGGTTTDVCLILDGTARVSSDRRLGGRPMRQPMVAVESIGAGGGSIARLDHGSLRVGPESAGTAPGPACYGRGGRQPTITDANLVLGYMDADRPLGGDLRLDPARARASLQPLAEAMGTSVEAAALGVVRVANDAMMQAVRRITVENGIDGRSATLIAFGGAGSMHAVAVAREFGMETVVVPAHSSVFSALGCVSAEMSYSQQQTVRMAVDGWDAATLAGIRDGLRDRLTARLKAAGHSPECIRVQEVAAIRYSGQSYAIEVADPDFDDPARLGQAFVELHERLYGFATDEPWQLETLRLRAYVPGGRSLRTVPQVAGGACRPTRTLPCWFDPEGPVATPRYRRDDISPGFAIEGPAIVEDAHSTVVVPPAASLSADSGLHLRIATGAGA